ncbi:MAG: hypothetical protein LLF84_06765 [Methanoregulaceae archaeon]|nr:hypothetical protein [Methanoregulaceae archaeon]
MVAASAALVLVALIMRRPPGLTLPAGCSALASLSVRQVKRSVCKIPSPPLAPKGRYPMYCLSLGKGGARPEGCERGGYLSIPRRDARAGEWGKQIYGNEVGI